MRQLFFIILSLWSICTSAQNYPVQSSVQLNRPYSVRLSDYNAPGNDRLSVTLWLKDLNKPALNVKLRLRIEGLNNAVRIVSNTYGNYPQLPLDPGVPILLSSTDLTPYFALSNLNFERGLNKQHFARTGELPEGLYKISIEALDYQTNRQVSNTGSATAWMIKNEPPLLNFPANKQYISQIDPPNIAFQWTPRHTASPNTVMNAEYTLEFVELRTPQLQKDPVNAFLSAQRFATISTFSTSYFYGLADLPMEPGMHYAWRVRASAEDGADLFTNNGWSEVRTFQFGTACTDVVNLIAEVESPHNILLEWDDDLGHTRFEVQYRMKSADGNTAWTTEKANYPSLRLQKLEDDQEYEFRVRAICISGTTEYTPIVEARTMEKIEREFVCGATSVPFDLKLKELIPNLERGDIIWANDFDIELTDVKKSEKGYTGEGVMVMPMMNFAKVCVEFQNIKVNPEMRMYEGEIYATGVTVQVVPNEVLDFIAGLKDFFPEEVSQNIENAENALEEAKNEYWEAKNDRKELEKEESELIASTEDNSYTENNTDTTSPLQDISNQISEAHNAEVQARNDKSEANKELVKAYMDALKSVHSVLFELVKDLTEYSTGVANIIKAGGPQRSAHEAKTKETGEKILAFLEKIDGKKAPERPIPNLELIPKEYIEKINEINAVAGINADVMQMTSHQIEDLPVLAQLQLVWGTAIQAKELIENGEVTEVTSVIELIRQSISLLNSLIDISSEFRGNGGEIKDAEGWSETDLITFENVSGELGFDNAPTQYPALGTYYTQINFGENKDPYWVPWKAVPENGTGFVKLKWSKGTPDWTKLKAKDEDGNEITIDASQKLQVSGDGKKKTYQIFKTEERKEDLIVGELLVKEYEPKNKQVYIVQLNGNNTHLPTQTDLEASLNEIYGIANINWDVQEYQNLALDTWDENADGYIDASETAELATYTPEMRNIINAYRSTNKPKGDEFVLFWVKGASTQSLDGYMPLSRRYGFIFSDAISSTTNAQRTIAHELGHGAFALDHPWTLIEGLEKGQTQNLMDYAGGTELWKWQWDQLHNPPVMIGYEQEDEEGRLVTENPNMIFVRFLKEIACAKQNNKSEFDFYYAKSAANEITANSWGLGSESFVKALGIENSSIGWSNTKNILFNIPEALFKGQKADLFHYASVPVDISAINFMSEKKIVGGVFPLLEIGTGNKKITVNLSLSFDDHEFKEISRLVNELFEDYEIVSSTVEVKDLSTFTKCDFEALQIQNRINLLEELGGLVNGQSLSPNDDDTKQLYVVRILESISTKSDRILVYDFFDTHQELLVNYYNYFDDETKDWLITQIYFLWLVKYQENQSAFAEATTFVLSSNWWGNAEQKLILEDKLLKQPYQYKDRAGANSHGTPVDVTKVGYKELGSLFSPFLIQEQDNIVGIEHLSVVPGIFLKHLLDQNNADTAAKYRSLAIDAALLVVGVGEITIAVRSIKSISVGLTAYKAALGTGDIAITVLDQVAELEEYKNSDFIKTWKGTVGNVTKVAFLGASLRDLYTSNLKTGYEEIRPSLVENQVRHTNGELYTDIIEESLGLRNITSVGFDADIVRAKKFLENKSTKSVYDLLIHHDGTKFQIYQHEKWYAITERDLSNWIKRNDALKEVTEIRLLACQVAGKNSSFNKLSDVSQNIANNTNKKIRSADGEVWVHSNGEVTVGTSPNDNKGNWFEYTPNSERKSLGVQGIVPSGARTSNTVVRMGSPTNKLADRIESLKFLFTKYNLSNDDWQFLINRHGDLLEQRFNALAIYAKATEGRAGALAMMKGVPTNNIDSIIKKLESFDSDDVRKLFFSNLGKKNNVLPSNVSQLQDNIDKLTEKHLEVWEILYKENHTNRKFDYDFIDTHVKQNSTPTQIKDSAQKAKNRADHAKGVNNPTRKRYIEESVSSYRRKLVDNILDKINNGGITELEALYKNDSHITNQLNNITPPLTRAKVEEIFKGYHAHHIIPANTLWNDGIFKTLLDKCNEVGIKVDFDFNSMDNLIFLDPKVHLNGVRGHNNYDLYLKSMLEDNLAKYLEKKYQTEYHLNKAIEDIHNICAEFKTLISKDYIGSSQYIDLIQ